jgi:hypothetical protein
MKIYYESLINSIKRHTHSLEKQSLFINEPWALVDNEMEVQKFIFKKGGELILSKNGEVTKGRWEYLPEAKSLLIEQKSGNLLLNEVFLDGSVLMLKVDGTNDSFYPLANTNQIPDLNIPKYLFKMRIENEGVGNVELTDGQTLFISNADHFIKHQSIHDLKNKEAFLLGDNYQMIGVPDNEYLFQKKSDWYFRLKNNKIKEAASWISFDDVYSNVVRILDGSKYSFKFNQGKTVLKGFDLYPNSTIVLKNKYVIETNSKSKVAKIFKRQKFKTREGLELLIVTAKHKKLSSGDRIIQPENLPNGRYKIKGKFKYIDVDRNRIVKTGFAF